jgi:hypothetical protein
MSRALRVRWTIVPKIFPQPWRPCSRCGALRPFRCSEKFRLNANGKRLDAWLIYKCTTCDGSWNHAVFERRAAREVEPELLAALQANDPALVRRYAFDLAALRKGAHRVEEFAEVEVAKELIAETSGATPSLQITLAVPVAVSIRLDRLLASELGLSRNRVTFLADAGRLVTRATLAKPARDGTEVAVQLAREPDAESILGAALARR